MSRQPGPAGRAALHAGPHLQSTIQLSSRVQQCVRAGPPQDVSAWGSAGGKQRGPHCTSGRGAAHLEHGAHRPQQLAGRSAAQLAEAAGLTAPGCCCGGTRCGRARRGLFLVLILLLIRAGQGVKCDAAGEGLRPAAQAVNGVRMPEAPKGTEAVPNIDHPAGTGQEGHSASRPEQGSQAPCSRHGQLMPRPSPRPPSPYHSSSSCPVPLLVWAALWACLDPPSRSCGAAPAWESRASAHPNTVVPTTSMVSWPRLRHMSTSAPEAAAPASRSRSRAADCAMRTLCTCAGRGVAGRPR